MARPFIFCLVIYNFLAFDTKAQSPHMGQSMQDGLGNYTYIEKESTGSVLLFRGSSNDVKKLEVKFSTIANNGKEISVIRSMPDNSDWNCSGDQSLSKSINSINFSTLFANVISAGSFINASIFKTNCQNQISPNGPIGFNARNFRIFDIQTQFHPNLSNEVLFDNKPYLVGAFKLDAGDGQSYLTQLKVINRGNAREGKSLSNDVFKVYYEIASNKFEFEGSEIFAGQLYGNDKGDDVENNVFGSSELKIPVDKPVWIYVVMQSSEDFEIESPEEKVTISLAIPDDGLAFSDESGETGKARVAEINISEDKAIALPLKWISFKGREQKNSILLQWVTTSQLDVDYFQIEACLDNSNWNVIGRVNVGSLVTNSYTFEDNRNIRGINYFRILQVDNNDQRSYSKVIAVKKADRTRYLVYPNNTHNILSVTNEVGERYTGRLVVYDSAGRKYVLNSDNKLYLVTNLQPGIYFANVGDQYLKFIKY